MALPIPGVGPRGLIEIEADARDVRGKRKVNKLFFKTNDFFLGVPTTRAPRAPRAHRMHRVAGEPLSFAKAFLALG